MTLARRLDDIDRKLKALEEHKKENEEAQITRYILELCVKTKTLEKNDKLLKECIGDLKAMFDAYEQSLSEMGTDIIRLMDAYYKVFPERAEQDVRVQRQLDKLNPRKKPPNSKK